MPLNHYLKWGRTGPIFSYRTDVVNASDRNSDCKIATFSSLQSENFIEDIPMKGMGSLPSLVQYRHCTGACTTTTMLSNMNIEYVERFQ